MTKEPEGRKTSACKQLLINRKKMKGIANIRLPSGKIRLAELHWYEAHGIGKKEIKRKKYLE